MSRLSLVSAADVQQNLDDLQRLDALRHSPQTAPRSIDDVLNS